jgi:SagB-type dehydrogenase family enzyme
MLLYSYGHLVRRLAPTANSDLGGLPWSPTANYSRGTASGGGLYPVSIYWAAGPGAPVLPGLYYYQQPHHAVQRLLTGDVTGRIHAALADAGLPDTGQYLILGIKFWQNAFKYNSFSYHAVTMDVGTVLETWRMWARGRGLDLAPYLWFDEAAVGALLGVDPDAEGVYAVVPITWAGCARGGGDSAGSIEPRVRYAEHERSRRVLTFDMITGMQRATAAEGPDRPEREALKAARAAEVPAVADAVVGLPPAEFPEVSLPRVLRTRRSSFGRFAATRQLSAADLGAVLASAAYAGRFPCDVADEAADSGPDSGPDCGLARLFVFVEHVAGVPAGAYCYDAARHRLVPVAPGSHATFLQSTYFLDNYNVEQAGAVLVPTLRVPAVLDAVGDRGYRLTNAIIGAVSQATYTAASAAGIACGAALGFDNVSYTGELGLEDSDEVPLIMIMLGHERPGGADYRFEVAPMLLPTESTESTGSAESAEVRS